MSPRSLGVRILEGVMLANSARILLLLLLIPAIPTGKGDSHLFPQAHLKKVAVPFFQESGVRFDWALGALTGPNRTLVSIGRQATLKSGDELKMFLRLKQRGFVYVVLHDSDNGLTLLYPGAIPSGEPAVDVPSYVPAGPAWMRLDDHVGVETIHLIASSTRLDKLEDALKQYASSKTTDRSADAKRVLGEIASAKQQFTPGTSPTERPVEIAGRVRGTQPDVAAHATEVSARRFYSRTITIDHR